ncbi:sugar binding domain protein glycosyl hydrolase family 2 [Prevotella sp. CAG:592]|nr:sugar binding domain protein glycosyl hydrolase family 2 [Prevotella sp. CAG:592]
MKVDANSEIALAADDALFYVFTDNEIDADYLYQPKHVGEMIPIDNNGWKVTFETTGKVVEMKELKDWTSFTDDNSIRYYSGHAAYETTFKRKHSPAKDESVVIDLGTVADIATVYVNGKQCGTAWRPPYTVDITQAVKKGKNSLKIVVVNTWANALQGNDEGKAPFTGIWTNGKYRRASKDLLPSGLTSPIMISK